LPPRTAADAHDATPADDPETASAAATPEQLVDVSSHPSQLLTLEVLRRPVEFTLLFTIFISPVTMFLMANEVEKLYVDAGEQPRITTLWGLWFLLPLIGNIIWYVRIQHAINGYWQARGGTTSPGLA
jgi:hypothetical protein